MRKKSKVKFNIKNVHYAPHVVGETGEITFGTPVAIPGARSISLEATGEISKWYADGKVYYQTAANGGYEGDLVMALIPDDFRKAILAEVEDVKKVLIENANVELSGFALLFEIDGDQSSTRFCFYNCSCSRPNVESETTEDTKEPGEETLAITCSPMENGIVRAKTTAETEEQVYSNWYKTVYQTEEVEETGK